MSVSDLITFLSILVVILLAIVPGNKYFLLKWRLSSKWLWAFSICSVIYLLISINFDVFVNLFPCLSIFYFNSKYLPTDKTWALIYSLYIIWLLIFKQFSAKLSPNKSKEICDYFHELLSDEHYLEVVQKLQTEKIISDLQNKIPKTLSIGTYKVLVRYEKFIYFIANRKPMLFIDAMLRYGNNQPCFAVFIEGVLTSEELLIEINEYTQNKKTIDVIESNTIIERLIFQQGGMDDSGYGIHLFFICEPALKDLKNKDVKQNLLAIPYHEYNSREVNKYKIYPAIKLLKLKAEYLIKKELTQTDWLRYYESFIKEIIEIGIDQTANSLRIHILDIIIDDFTNKLKKFSYKNTLILDYFKILMNIIKIFSEDNNLSQEQNKKYISLLLREILYIKDTDLLTDCLKEFINRNVDLFNNSRVSFKIISILEELRLEADFNYNDNIKGLLKDFFTVKLLKFKEYNNYFTEKSFSDSRRRSSHSIMAYNLRLELLKELDISDILFYPPWIPVSNDISKTIQYEKDKFKENRFEEYWSFIEIYKVERNVDNSTSLKKVINSDQFQIPNSLHQIKKQYNLQSVPEFYDERFCYNFVDKSFYSTIIESNPHVKELNLENIKDIRLEYISEYLFESIFENDFFICYFRFNFVKDLAEIIAGEKRFYPHTYIMVKVGIKLTESSVEIQLFEKEKNEVYKFPFNGNKIPSYIIKRLIFEIEELT